MYTPPLSRRGNTRYNGTETRKAFSGRLRRNQITKDSSLTKRRSKLAKAGTVHELEQPINNQQQETRAATTGSVRKQHAPITTLSHGETKQALQRRGAAGRGVVPKAEAKADGPRRSIVLDVFKAAKVDIAQRHHSARVS